MKEIIIRLTRWSANRCGFTGQEESWFSLSPSLGNKSFALYISL